MRKMKFPTALLPPSLGIAVVPGRQSRAFTWYCFGVVAVPQKPHCRIIFSAAPVILRCLLFAAGASGTKGLAISTTATTTAQQRRQRRLQLASPSCDLLTRRNESIDSFPLSLSLSLHLYPYGCNPPNRLVAAKHRGRARRPAAHAALSCGLAGPLALGELAVTCCASCEDPPLHRSRHVPSHDQRSGLPRHHR